MSAVSQPLQFPGTGKLHQPAAPVPTDDVPAKAPHKRFAPPKARTRLQLWAVIWTVFALAIPLVTAATHLWIIAADQYVTEFRFAIRGLEHGKDDTLTGLTGLPSNRAAQILSDAYVVTEYIGSRQIVEEVRKSVDLTALYTAPKGDLASRLEGGAPFERLADFWGSKVEARFDMVTGIVSVSVRAFEPKDSYDLAVAIVNASRQMFVKMGERAREEATRYAEQDLKRAEQRLADLRSRLQTLRRDLSIVDSKGTVQATVEMVGRMREELAKLNAELATRRSYLSEGSAQVKVLREQIRAAEDQLRKIDASRLSGDRSSAPSAIGEALAKFEALSTDLQFAEKSYANALESLDRARANADRATSFLSLFVEPRVSESSVYPRRAGSFLIVLAVAIAAWCIGMLLLQSVRDHLVH